MKVVIPLTKPLRRLAAGLLCLALLLAACPLSAGAEGYGLPSDVTISAKAAILVSLGATEEEDVVIYAQGADDKLAPAALVRLMVGLTAMEIIGEKGLDLDRDTGTFTRACNAAISGTGLILANMKVGESWPLRDLLTLSMIHTAGDACMTLAYALAGSEQAFVERMNQTAEKMGLTNTFFGNVTGLDKAVQVTTARDTWKILRAVIASPTLADMLRTESYAGTNTDGVKGNTYANSNSMMLGSNASYYKAMQYGRTGYVESVGRNLASVAMDGGYQYLCVVIGSEGGTGHFKDSRALYNWVFNSFSYRILLSRNMPMSTAVAVDLAWNKDKIQLVPEHDIAAIVPKYLDETAIIFKYDIPRERVEAPVEKNAVLGRVDLYINVDQKIGSCNLVASESVERSDILALWNTVQKVLKSPWFIGGLALLAFLVVGYVVLNIAYNHKRRRKKMKRVKKYKNR